MKRNFFLTVTTYKKESFTYIAYYYDFVTGKQYELDRDEMKYELDEDFELYVRQMYAEEKGACQ